MRSTILIPRLRAAFDGRVVAPGDPTYDQARSVFSGNFAHQRPAVIIRPAERIRQAYPGSTWQRLVAVKARYDPTNLFHRNHNVSPATKDTQRP